jgi:hypothetical protein
MAAGIVDGQPVAASASNAAWIAKNGDDSFVGELTAASVAPAAGATVISIQREHNAISSFVGSILNSVYNVLPVWVTNNFGTSIDTLFMRVKAIDLAFSSAGTEKVLSGVTNLPNGSLSVTISLGTTLPSTSYAVDVTMQNLGDSDPIFMSHIITIKTTTSFTVTFNAAADSINYYVNWMVKRL